MLRATFWTVAAYSLFKTVALAEEEQYQPKSKLYAGFLAALIIVSMIITGILQQVMIFLILISPTLFLLFFIPWALIFLPLILVQKRINTYWQHRLGSKLVESPFTSRDYVVLALGGLVIASIMYTLIRINSLTAQLKEPSAAYDGLEASLQITPTISTPTPARTPTPTLKAENTSTIDAGHLPVKGDPNAPVTIVEFGSFQCPYCKRVHEEALKDIDKWYIQTGKVKLAFRHSPLTMVYPSAQRAGEASECANEQQKFWEYHDILFAEQDNWSKKATSEELNDTLTEYAKRLNLDTTTFRDCLVTGKFQENVTKDDTAAFAIAGGVTPTFYINGQKIEGAHPFTTFAEAIEAALNPGQASKEVDSTLKGKWSGQVRQTDARGASEYDVVIELKPGNKNQVVGTSTYPSLQCGGDLYLLETKPKNGLIVEEKITSGKDKCVNSVKLALGLGTDDKLTYYFEDGAIIGQGYLDHIR